MRVHDFSIFTGWDMTGSKVLIIGPFSLRSSGVRNKTEVRMCGRIWVVLKGWLKQEEEQR